MTLISPLNLEQILVTNLAGTPEIFSFLAVLLVALVTAYFGMSKSHALIMFVLFGVLMASYLQGLYVLIILVVGVVSFYSISRSIKN